MTQTTDAAATWRCPGCGFAITDHAHRLVSGDFHCPHCHNHAVSEFRWTPAPPQGQVQ